MTRASKTSEPFHYDISPQFSIAISKGDVDTAFKLWTGALEHILIKVARAQGHEIHTRSASHRGQILFHEQRLHPKVVHDAATTLKGRSLWKGYCRAVELSKISLGVRQEKTLDNLSAGEQWLSSDHLAQFEALIAQPFSNHIGLQLAALLEKAIEENDRADKQARILKWKQSLRRANRDTYSFLKHKIPHAAVRLSMVEASPTADLHSRLDSISEVWRNIYNQHKNNEPTFRNFLAEFGPTMQTHVAEIPDLSQQLITDTLMRMRPSSPGLDQIAIDELQIAVSHCPQLVSALCQLFQCIEQKGKWPIPLTKGAVTFIPKENEDEFLSPDKYRPITILSSIYRLWSATRHDQLASLWFPFWRHSQCYGGKGCKSADELAFQTCKQLQQAQRNQLFAAGVSFDLAKCFDSVPITLALDIVQFRGAPYSEFSRNQDVDSVTPINLRWLFLPIHKQTHEGTQWQHCTNRVTLTNFSIQYKRPHRAWPLATAP